MPLRMAWGQGSGCVAHLAVKTPDTQPTTASTSVGLRTGGWVRKPGSGEASASSPVSAPASTKQGTWWLTIVANAAA